MLPRHSQPPTNPLLKPQLKCEPNEGRRRPSLIAACPPDLTSPVDVRQRGAPAPLPHCGVFMRNCFMCGGLQRGAPAPLPHCGYDTAALADAKSRATRGAGAPPSLRHHPCLRFIMSTTIQRGAPAPLPHCGLLAPPSDVIGGLQRGAPAPLPHCGNRSAKTFPGFSPQRGAPAPLPHCGRLRFHYLVINTRGNEGRRRPSLIAACRSGSRRARSSRNEGRRRPSLIAASKTRSNFTAIIVNEGRRRPSLIAAHQAEAGQDAPASNEGRRRPSLIAAST